MALALVMYMHMYMCGSKLAVKLMVATSPMETQQTEVHVICTLGQTYCMHVLG